MWWDRFVRDRCCVVWRNRGGIVERGFQLSWVGEHSPPGISELLLLQTQACLFSFLCAGNWVFCVDVEDAMCEEAMQLNFRPLTTYIYIHTHTHIYIYIYIYY